MFVGGCVLVGGGVFVDVGGCVFVGGRVFVAVGTVVFVEVGLVVFVGGGVFVEGDSPHLISTWEIALHSLPLPIRLILTVLVPIPFTR